MCFLLLSGSAISQNTYHGPPEKMDLVFQTRHATWFGLDFSNAYFLNSLKFGNPETLKNYLFKAWNILILAEKDKYDIGKAFYKDSITFSLENVTERYKKVNVFDRIIDDPNKALHLTVENVKEIIREYHFKPEEKGLGIVFIVESFDKFEQTGYYWVTLFSIEDKEVLLTERMSGKSSGFGLKNYWAGSYYHVLKNIYFRRYLEWKKEFYTEKE